MRCRLVNGWLVATGLLAAGDGFTYDASRAIGKLGEVAATIVGLRQVAEQGYNGVVQAGGSSGHVVGGRWVTMVSGAR